MTIVQTDPGRPAPEQVEAATGPEPHEAADVREAWVTVSLRPAGALGRRDVGRLRQLLDALSACASIVVLDLAAANLRSGRAAAVIEDAARRLDRSGGALLCVHADEEAARVLAGGHAVVLRDPAQWSGAATG